MMLDDKNLTTITIEDQILVVEIRTIMLYHNKWVVVAWIEIYRRIQEQEIVVII